MGTFYTLRSGGTAHPESTLIQMITDFVKVGGVEDLSTDNHLKVVQRAAGANMSVDVSVGRAMVRKATGECYPVRHTTSASNVVVTANSSGQNRVDSVVLYIDLAESPNADSSDVAKLAVVAGTPGGSPTAPNAAAIETAIGSSNPYIVLADIAVANAAASIVTANITDKRQRFRLRSQIREVTDTDGATITFDVSQYNWHDVVLGGNRTLAVTGDSFNDGFVINLIQDGTGNRTVTWWSNIDWAGGTPVLTPTANRADTFLIVKKASGRYKGFVMGQDATIS